jgi:beta-xylosidase
MKSIATLLICVSLAVACGASTTPTPAPTPTASPAPVTPAPTAVPTPTASPAAVTPAPTGSPIVTPSSLFRDDFDRTLAAGWEWLNEDPSAWNLTEEPGLLRIYITPRSIRDEDPKNFLVRPAPTGDFVLETFMRFEPVRNFEFAGLLIYEQQRSAVQFGRGFALDCGPACMGNALYLEGVATGVSTGPNIGTSVDETGTAYLRLARLGNEYSAFYSVDGASWTAVGRLEATISPQFVGLIAGQGPPAANAADFDYFMIGPVSAPLASSTRLGR